MSDNKQDVNRDIIKHCYDAAYEVIRGHLASSTADAIATDISVKFSDMHFRGTKETKLEVVTRRLEKWAKTLQHGTPSEHLHDILRDYDQSIDEKRKSPYSQEKICEAFKVIKESMQADSPSEPGSYAHGWHCNIAMMCVDAMQKELGSSVEYESLRSIGNDSASRFMKLCFDVETKAN